MIRERYALPHDRVPLRVWQVYQRIRSEILSGRLAPGAAAVLANVGNELRVARGTVGTAFSCSRRRLHRERSSARNDGESGVATRARASVTGKIRVTPGKVRRNTPAPPHARFYFKWDRRHWMHSRASDGPGSPRVLRGSSIANRWRSNLHDVMGYEPLRRAIASYLRISRDIACSADQI